MIYQTTRNSNEAKQFEEIVLSSNASCGGLYIPKVFPQLKKQDFIGLSYQKIAQKIIEMFTNIPKNEIEEICEKSLKNFENDEPVFIKKLSENLTVAELFHGPTLSFKDYPMQFLGNIIEHILHKNNQKLNIITATSGDTGSAAIHAFAGKENVKIVVLHPNNCVTQFQRKQMTTVNAENVLNIAVEGTFDDCQAIVKSITNSHFAKELNISTVNSINWGRIMMQIVYYIWLSCRNKNANFFVPTGNFGNIFACYFLKKCGFEGINKLYISNNANDVLFNFFTTGVLKNQETVHTNSPAVDISKPSNFERMVFIESGFNANYTKTLFTEFQKHDTKTTTKLHQNFCENFGVASISQEKTIDTIKKVYETYQYIICPHTALSFGHYFEKKPAEKTVIIATAHPCKFEDTVEKAINFKQEIPENNKNILTMEEKFEILKIDQIQAKVLTYFKN